MDSLKNAGHDHETIIELLPDYAIGALDERTTADVQQHLASCQSCGLEHVSILEVMGILGNAAAPDPAVRAAFLARATLERPISAGADELKVPRSPSSHLAQDAQPRGLQRPTPIAPQWRRALPLAFAAAAAALLLLAMFAPWRSAQQDPAARVIAEIVTTAPSFELADSDQEPPASGVLYAEANENRAVLVARDLAPLDEGQQYQIWLFKSDGERTSAGQFSPDSNGQVEILIETPLALASYSAIAVSAEPADGSQAPTSPLTLGGWLQLP